MNINGIKYSRKFNLGSYESEDISVEASIAEGENPSECLKQMMEFVNSRGREGVGQSPVSKKLDTKVVNKEEEKQLEFSENTSTSAPVEPVKPETQKSKEKQKDKRVKEIPATPEERATSKTVAKPNSKVTAYDRNLDLHKKLVVELLDSSYPNWKANPAKAKEASVKLEGKEFLDNEGIILPEFKAAFAEAMK